MADRKVYMNDNFLFDGLKNPQPLSRNRSKTFSFKTPWIITPQIFRPSFGPDTQSKTEILIRHSIIFICANDSSFKKFVWPLALVRYYIFNKASFAIGNLAYSSLCTYQFFSVTTFGVMKNVSDPIRRLSSIVVAIVVLLNAGDDSASGGIICGWCNCKKEIILLQKQTNKNIVKKATVMAALLGWRDCTKNMRT
jgi:Na+/proline symporter